MKWLGSFFLATFVLLVSATSVSANSNVEEHDHNHAEPLAALSCNATASGLHEMKAIGTATVGNGSTTIISLGQAWKCSGCGVRLVTQNYSYASSFGKYIENSDLKVVGENNSVNIYTTTKSLGDLKSTSNRYIAGYQFQ